MAGSRGGQAQARRAGISLSSRDRAPPKPPVPMSLTTQLVRIHDLFDRWRSLGHVELADGTELIGRCEGDGDDGDTWMHAVFPGLPQTAVEELEQQLGKRLPVGVRGMFHYVGGLTLFSGAFELHGRRVNAGLHRHEPPHPQDLVALDREIDALGWLPEGAVAFATNAWDLSVHVAGMSASPQEIVRCERATGQVKERHRDVWSCIAHRLYRLDRLALA